MLEDIEIQQFAKKALIVLIFGIVVYCYVSGVLQIKQQLNNQHRKRSVEYKELKFVLLGSSAVLLYLYDLQKH